MPSSTAKTSITTRHTGTTYFIITEYIDARPNSPERDTSSMTDLGFIIYATSTEVRSATIGIIMLFVKKSKKSRIWNLPKMRTESHALYPRQESAPRARLMPRTMRQDTHLFIFHFSETVATTVSIRDIDEVSAARMTIRKKMAPINAPPNIFIKTFGSTPNIRLGPFDICAGSYATQAGTIIRPERKATPVSKSSMLKADFSIFISFFIYEPKVIRIPIAIDIE